MMWCCCNSIELTGCLGTSSISLVEDDFSDESLTRPWTPAVSGVNYLVSGGKMLCTVTDFPTGPDLRTLHIPACVDLTAWPVGEFVELHVLTASPSPVVTRPFDTLFEAVDIGGHIWEYIRESSGDIHMRFRIGGGGTLYDTPELLINNTELRLRLTKTSSAMCTVLAHFQGIEKLNQTGVALPASVGASTPLLFQMRRWTTGSSTGFDTAFGFESLRMERSW